MWDENFKYLVNYYNNGNGIDLPAEQDELGKAIPYRAVCANIAWCMFNKERFWEYYNKSEYWRVKLMTALKFYGSKHYYYRQIEDSDNIKQIRNIVINNFGKKLIVKPCNFELLFDIDTVNQILGDAQANLKGV